MMEQWKNYFLRLNIYQKLSHYQQETNEDLHEQRTQVIATRVYFVLLVLILIIFLLFTSFNSETITNTVHNPTFEQIQSFPTDRICPCSTVSFSYDKFVSTNASFHQVCSSDFVSNRWISSLFYGMNTTHFLHLDFRSVGFAQFRALASFCQLSRASVNETLSLFGSSLFISSYLDSSPANLRTKVMTTFNQFNSSMATTLKSRIQLISTIITGNQFLNALETNIIPYCHNDSQFVRVYGNEVRYYIVPYQQKAGGSTYFCTLSETFTEQECRGPSGIFQDGISVDIQYLVDEWYVPTMSIPGFVSSCMPVDACLLSSLECFFNQSCVNAIFPYQRMTDGAMRNFTALNSNTTLKPSRFNVNSSIKSIVDQLMVEEWFIEEQNLYKKYFQQCAPVVCTYLTNVYPDFLSILNTFVGLLGGLCSVLQFIVLLVVKFTRRRLYPPPNNAESEESPQVSFVARWHRRILSTLKRVIAELNLFKMISNDNNNQSEIQYQRIATRLYIALLGLILGILTLYLALIPQTYIRKIENPSPANFSHYYSLYRSSFQCTCSSISISHSIFLTIKPSYHHTCSSRIVSSEYISYLQNTFAIPRIVDSRFDYSRRAGSQFMLLKRLCTEAEQMIQHSLEQFLNQTLITNQVISEERFEKQAKLLIEEWKISTNRNFLRTLRLVEDIQYGNHLAALSSNSYFDLKMIPNTFVVNVLIYYDQCNCMLTPSCHALMRVYNIHEFQFSDKFEVPGFLVGCFPLKALLQSTLECFYNQTCINIIDGRIRFGQHGFNLTALNASLSLPNETIGHLVDKLFVDDWSEKISFNDYFKSCAPQSCTYEYIARRNLIFLVISIISIFGGLSTGLKILFVVLLWIITKIKRGKISLRAIRSWLHTRLTEKQHLTRGIHIVLVVTTITILYLSSKFAQRTTTMQTSDTSIQNYEKLLARYSDALQCPCQQISTSYKSFMNITVWNRHEVCSSVFIRNEWISTLPLPIPRKGYSTLDFNRTTIGFFQLLASLCRLSEQHLIDEISNLMRRTLVNTNVISRQQFNEQIQSIIDQFEQNIPFSFLITLQLIRAMISDNQLMTIFETNWQWMDPIFDHPDHVYVKFHTKPIVYNGSCDCALSSGCVEESSTMPGLMVGCYPLESLLKSNLHCLYNVSCFSLLQSVNQSFKPLDDSIPSRYEKNSTIESILNHLMVERWNRNISYEKYYDQCAPSFCSYSYVEHNPALQALILLLGLYGGLVIIMNVLALLLVALWQKIIKRHRCRVQIQPM